MVKIAQEINKEYEVNCKIVGFESGEGLAPALTHKDHPEILAPSVFAPSSIPDLQPRFRGKANLQIRKIEDTVDTFIMLLQPMLPLDLWPLMWIDYQATVATLRELNGPPEKYLPTVSVYLDDIAQYESNRWCGELAAIHQFNAKNDLRKIDDDRTLYDRPIPNAKWHKKIFTMQCFDHPSRKNFK